MSRRFMILVVLIVVSALGVIDLRHRNRMDFVKLQSLQRERDALNVEHGQLLLEEGTWAEHRRVESMARARLGMALPSAEQTVVIYTGRGRP